MQTSQLQSLLCRNAAAITLLTNTMVNDRAMSKDAHFAESRAQFRKAITKARSQIIKLAAIQKAIKFDLHATKLARLQQAGRRSKHNKDDPRYAAWYAAVQAGDAARVAAGYAVVGV